MQKSGSLHLTKKTEYGLFLLATLAKRGKSGHLSINTIAQENNVPLAFLQKIANSLQKQKLIKSERGKYGGHILAKPANKITIREVVEVLEGQIAIAPCLRKGAKKCKHENFCQIKNSLSKINDEIKDHFLSKTIDKITL
ncbi:MAG: Rrf2 family transcriptional regulator [Candidatus Gracilibacteria bacterium]|jgi:Rrf2 family protein